MEARAYFNNEIKPAICDELNKSSKNIYAAVAWFNDNDIFEIIKEKARNNVDINIIIANDEINSTLPFKEISDLDGKVFKLIKDNALLHHKFCVIDEHTLITGSYNWTYAANNKNLENIIILENNIKLNQSYIQCFNNILDEEFKYIEETINILGYMQEEIENLKNSIKKYKEVPLQVMYGIEKIKSQNLMLDTPLNSLLSLDNTKEDNYSQSIPKTINEKIDWWNSLEINWKLFFNEKIFGIGAITDMPDMDGIERLLSLTYVNCSKHYSYVKETKTRYDLNNLTGIKEITSINTLDCSSNNITKLDPISGHKNLIKLICNNNKIPSLESISLLSNLTHLECNNNNLTSLKGLETLSSLEYLKIDVRFKDSQRDLDRIYSLNLIEVGKDNSSIEFRKKSELL